MTDDGLQRARADPRAERAADVGWEPPDRDALLRRRSIAQRRLADPLPSEDSP